MTAAEEDAPAEVLRWVERSVGATSRVVRCQPLVGGITSAVQLIDIESDGELRQLVLKRWTEGDLAERRRWIDREAQVLQVLEAAEIPAPRLLASTAGGEVGGVPALLMSRLPGKVWLTPTDSRLWLRQIATSLARLHDVRPPDGLPAAEPTRRRVRTPPDSLQPELWSSAATFLSQPAPAGEALIHGDYQHFNLLWQDGRLSGVVDWTWTGIAHPDRDVGHCRLNLAVLFSSQWADDFVAAYESEAGRPTEPWWHAAELAKYGNDSWQEFIPIQVAGRVAVDAAGMTARVEDQLRRVVG